MASEVIGHCELCGLPLTSLAELGIVSVSHEPDHVRYTKVCAKSPNGHLLRLHLGVPGLPPVVVDRIGKWAADAHEAERRKRNRDIAEAHAKELAEHRGHQAVMGEWHDGTCTGCGTETTLIGVPGSDLCEYCEELRILTPPQPKPIEAKPAELPVFAAARRARHLLGLAFLMVAVITAVANVTDGVFIPGLFVVWGVLLIKSAQ